MKHTTALLSLLLLAETGGAAHATLSWYFGGKRRQPKTMGTAAA